MDNNNNGGDSSQCPFLSGDQKKTAGRGTSNRDWWPNELKLNIELYTLTFEQINHLWGSLGGKQVPFAMYKVRLVRIQENTRQDAPLIETIRTVETVINAECDE